MGRFDNQMSRMKSLMNYGIVSENTNNGNHNVEFTAEAADGKIYGIVREGTKFYIKRTEKGKETLAESFDYIGGWNNRKDHEYTSYNNALKQFELKVRSINEAITGKGNFNAFDLDKKENLVIECTEKMGKEIARQREIMSKVGEKLNEATISCSNTGVPEAPKTASFSAKLGKPFDETATANLDKDMKKTASDPEKQGEPFGENQKTEEYKDAQYVPDNSVANKKPSGGKVVRVNEEKEDWASQGLPATPGVGSPDGHLMEGDDEVVDGTSFEGDDNPEVVNEDAPAGFAEEDEFESAEGEEVMDDDVIEMDPDVDLEGKEELGSEEETGDELDVDLEGGEELGSEEEFGDEDDDRIAELEDMIQMIMDELGLDAEEIGDDAEETEEFDDEDLYDDEGAEEDVDLKEPEFEDEGEELEEGGFFHNPNYGDDEQLAELPDEITIPESKKAQLDRIVEAVSRKFQLKNRPNSQGTVSKIEKAKSVFAAAIQDDLGNREDSANYSDLGYYDENGNLMDSQEDADDLLACFNEFADSAIAFYNATMPKYRVYKGATQMSNNLNDNISETDVDEVNAAYDQVAQMYANALVDLLDVRNEDLLDVDNIMDDDGLLPYGGDISKAIFVGPDQFIEGVDGHVLVQNNNFGEYSPYYVYMFYAVMKAVNKLKFNFEYFYDRVLNGREIAADAAAEKEANKVAEKPVAPQKPSEDDLAYANAEKEEKRSTIQGESKKSKKTMKEDKLNVFGKHPGYRKKPMNLPPTGEDKNQWGEDWNDESVYSEEPFGSKIGSSAPFDIVQHVTDSIMEQLKKKKVIELSERKVLKVPSSNPAPQMPMAPMGQDPMMGAGAEMPETDPMEQDPANVPPQDEQGDFGGNFDAGVEADEETDPQKFIQQLTGKLSQSLKKYNDENGEDESGLNKYVAGMIATQAAKGLTDSEKNEIIKKINSGDVEEEEPVDNGENPEGDDAMEMPEEMPMESKKYRFSKKQIKESILMRQDARNRDERNEDDKSPKVKNTVRNKPFNAPKFK